MKHILLVLSVFFFMTSCSKGNSSEEDCSEKQENSIYGAWKLVEVFGSNPRDPSWGSVKNSYTITLNKDNIFSSNKYKKCSGNTFNITDNSLTLYFDCDNGSSEEEPYSFTLENQELVLIPQDRFCVEGCGEKFKKISCKE